MMNLKNAFIGGLVVGALTLGVGIYKYFEPPLRTANITADVETSAIQIMDSYESDENLANSLYLNKYVDVTGIVSKVVQEEKCSVYLSTQSMLGYVIAELDDCQGLQSISKGSSLTVKGLCSGYLSDVILVRSVIKS